MWIYQVYIEGPNSRSPASGLGNAKFSSKDKRATRTSATRKESAEVLLSANAKNSPESESR